MRRTQHPRPDASARVRRIYEERPYVTAECGPRKLPRSLPVSVRWMRAAGRGDVPRRILVAGCGGGAEAFGLRRAFPRAEIVAVDFSPRSIATAQEWQKRSGADGKIRFLVADLTSRRLAAETGGEFDLITCHGVLSYIPGPERVLENLRRCATEEGALCLGVNGERHYSAGLRSGLPVLGFDMEKFDDGPKVRQALELCDALNAVRGRGRLSRFPAILLAGDAFGPLIYDWPLEKWMHLAEQAGWHLRGSFQPLNGLRQIWSDRVARQLSPRSRVEACRFYEAIRPAEFHRLMFSRQPERNPPWEDRERLLEWRPQVTPLYAPELPARTAGMSTVVLKSPPLNARIEWQVPPWGVEILRRAKGTRSLRAILGKHSVATSVLRRQLYPLYQLMVLNFEPPSQPPRGR